MPLEQAAGCNLLGFACGEPTLDEWLHRNAQRSEGMYARTYVVLTLSGHVAAYYCLCASSVERQVWPTAKHRHGMPATVPVVLLGRLGVDNTFQGRGLGTDLVAHAMRQCLSAARTIGVRAMIVHPLNDKASRFYGDFGFQKFQDRETAMFLPIETIAKEFEGSGC